MTDTDDADGGIGGGPRLIGINHVACEVGDVEESLEFYGSIFEFPLRGRSETAAFLDMGDQFLALMEVEGAGGSDEGRHVGLVVDDGEALKERLDDLGIDRLDTNGIDFRDPWGNRLQVVVYDEIQFSKAENVLSGMGFDGEKSDGAIGELAEKGMAPD